MITKSSAAFSLVVLVCISILSAAPHQFSSPVGPRQVSQDASQSYVTMFPSVPEGSPKPWLVYPTNSTIWVGGYVLSQGVPPTSGIREFFLNGTSKPVVTIRNLILSSILPDPTNPLTKIWFPENSTLAFFDTNNKTQTTESQEITFPGESIQYLASDSQNHIWMSAVGPAGLNNIIMYDPSNRLNQTFQIPTNGAFVQGITVAPDNTIWFAEAISKKIGHLIPGTGQIVEFAPPSTVNLYAPIQVALDTSGNVWFTDHASNQFGELDLHSQPPIWRVFPIGYCRDNCLYGLPNSIFVDASNTIWFSEHIAGRIGHYNPSTGVLTEYSVPGSTFPLMWWAMPGPHSLVWFVSWDLGEIGYVNASLPVAISVSGVSPAIRVQRGSYQRVPIVVTSTDSEMLSLNSSALNQDTSGYTPLVYSSSQSTTIQANAASSTSIQIFAAWNATLGQRVMAVTVYDSKVSLTMFVQVTVVDSSFPYFSIGIVSVMVIGGVTLAVRALTSPGKKALGKRKE